jgi:hypothetical protein
MYQEDVLNKHDPFDMAQAARVRYQTRHASVRRRSRGGVDVGSVGLQKFGPAADFANVPTVTRVTHGSVVAKRMRSVTMCSVISRTISSFEGS